MTERNGSAANGSVGPAHRVPHQAVQAEAACLGSMILDSSTVAEVVAILAGPTDFYVAAHQVIYSAILELESLVERIDSYTLCERLQRAGDLDRVGGEDAVYRLIDAAPHASSARYYAGLVRRAAMFRGLMEACELTMRDLNEGLSEPHEILAAAEQRFDALAEIGSDARLQTVADAANRVITQVHDRLDGSPPGLPTGFIDLDLALDGLRPGRLYIMAARPSMGKSALVANICQNLADEGCSSLLISLEMSAEEIATRMLLGHAGLTAASLRSPTQDTPHRLTEARLELDGCPIWIDDSPGRSLTQLAASARLAVRRRGCRLIVVDYLQLVESAGNSRDSNREQQVAEISRRLKHLARALSVPVLACCQLNRAAEHREDRRPRLADLRESGQIEQDADIVLLVHRPSYYNPDDQPGIAEVRIAKNRSGPTDMIRLAWLPDRMRFGSYTPRGDVPEPREACDDENPF